MVVSLYFGKAARLLVDEKVALVEITHSMICHILSVTHPMDNTTFALTHCMQQSALRTLVD